MTTRNTKSAIKSLEFRIAAQYEELATCRTAAQFKCVWQSITDTTRQLTELRG